MDNTITAKATDEYLAGKEITELLSQIGSRESGIHAKARIKSFLEAFVAEDGYCVEEGK